MQVKGLECATFNVCHTLNLHIASPLVIQNRKHTEKQKDKSNFCEIYDCI
jgi:hypothetical protein